MTSNEFEKQSNVKYAFDIFNVGSDTTFYTDWHGVYLHLNSMVTAPAAPGGTGCSSGTEDRRETIGKLVTVVAQKTVSSIRTAVVSGTPLDAVEA